MFTLAFVIVASRFAPPASADSRIVFPRELRLAIQSRAKLSTGDVSWTDIVTSGRPAEMLGEWRYEGRFGGDTRIVSRLGNKEGRINPTGDPVPMQRDFRDERGDTFTYTGRYQATLRSKTPYFIEDIRDLGLSDKLPAIIERAGLRKFAVTQVSDSLVRINCESEDDRKLRMSVTVDSDKAFAVTELSFSHGDKMSSRIVLRLERYGGTWFPREAIFYNAAGDMGRRVVVTSARFNQPAQPKKLTLTDVGVRSGEIVYNPWGADPARFGLRWNAAESRLMEAAEYSRRMKDGSFKEDPEITAEYRENNLRLGPPVGIFPGDPYRECAILFADEHGLSPPQRIAALSVAADIRERHKAATQPSDRKSIIEREPKPRLNRLLTTAERASASSQPAPR